MSLHDDVWDCVAHELCAAALHAARRNVGDEFRCNLTALCTLAATDRSIRTVLLPRMATVKVDATRLLVDALDCHRRKEPVVVMAEGRWRGQDNVLVPHVLSVRGANPASIVLPVDLLNQFPLLRLSNSAVSWCNVDDLSQPDPAAARMTPMGRPEAREVIVRATARLVARAETLARVPLDFHCVVHIHVIRTYMSAVASHVFEHHSCLSFERIVVATRKENSPG